MRALTSARPAGLLRYLLWGSLSSLPSKVESSVGRGPTITVTSSIPGRISLRSLSVIVGDLVDIRKGAIAREHFPSTLMNPGLCDVFCSLSLIFFVYLDRRTSSQLGMAISQVSTAFDSAMLIAIDLFVNLIGDYHARLDRTQKLVHHLVVNVFFPSCFHHFAIGDEEKVMNEKLPFQSDDSL